MRRKPTSWNDIEIIPFQIKLKKDPTGMPSIYTSSGPPRPGARIVVSQYGGAASAAACSYDYNLSDTNTSGVDSAKPTGGSSSFSSPARSGLAVKFEKTPSD